MNKAIITAASTERLKIVAFLLRLADWEVKVYSELPEAVNYLVNADKNGMHYDLLVVADYTSLGDDKDQRLFETQCLQLCRSLEQPLPIVMAGSSISDCEKSTLGRRVKGGIDFCTTDHLISHIESFRDQLNLQALNHS